jgi:hypothetical protein
MEISLKRTVDSWAAAPQ